MASYTAHIPDFTIKGADKTAAIAAAEQKVANHKAGLTVEKILAVPPPPAYLRRDDCTNPDPKSIWNLGGPFDQEGTGAIRHFTIGGPDNAPYRTITTSGKRWELGYNTWKGTTDGPPLQDVTQRASQLRTFWNYCEGDHLVTEWWMRLPADFPLETTSWQNIAQMKQAGPYPSSPSVLPVLHFEARRNALEVSNYDTASGNALLGCPLSKEVWTPCRAEVIYSSDPAKGRVQLTVGNNQSPAKNMRTLDNNPINPPFSSWQPSHLRLGLYHDPSLPGSYVDYSDIRISQG